MPKKPVKAKAKQLPAEIRPVGRPTLYLPEYCEQVVSFMGQGYSLTAFAGSIGVSYDTVSDWTKAHPEFLRAVNTGRASRTKHLEEGLLSSEVGPRVTARIFALKNAAPHEWRDRIETVVEVKAPPPIDARSLTDDEREAIRRVLVQAATRQITGDVIDGEFTEVDDEDE